MVKNRKNLDISGTEPLNLCIRWLILRSYCFFVELTFNKKTKAKLLEKKIDNLLAIEIIIIKKNRYLWMNLKSVISKIVIYQFWYDYLKPKYREKSKLSYMNTDSVIVYLKTEDIYVAIAKDVKKK